LLFWKFYQVSSGNLMSTFDWSDSAECPAGTTGSLVLYCVDGTCCYPVDASW
jgi:hypothetical protein